MYQREFAQRMIASPGGKDYGRLTLNVNLRARVEMMETVPRSAFRPSPQVESAVIRLRSREDKPQVNEGLFESLTRGLFNQRRKKVKTGLKKVGIPSEFISRIDNNLLERRPQELSLDDFVTLTNVISYYSV
jgi:16S rRNA (adenine1518-N6/adenine1519-N6)-dimethyltransferase